MSLLQKHVFILRRCDCWLWGVSVCCGGVSVPQRLPPTCGASLALLDVVEPERGQVQHLSGLHAAAHRPRPPVLGKLLQVRVQGVQRDPRDLGQRLSR